MTTRYETTTHPEATRQGFVPITSGYQDHEYDLLDKARATLGGIKHLLVTSLEGISIYRKQLEVNLLKDDR